MTTRKKACAALADAIRPKPPFGIGLSGPYLPLDLSPELLLLMGRLNDDADDAGVVDDFCACFHLNPKAVRSAIVAYRQALSATVH